MSSCRIKHLMQIWVIMFHPFIELRVWKHFPKIHECKSLPYFCKRDSSEATKYLIRKCLDKIN
jgi:hypothetical protein